MKTIIKTMMNTKIKTKMDFDITIIMKTCMKPSGTRRDN